MTLNPWKGLGSLPRSVWVVFTATLVNRAGTMVLPFLVLYLTRSMGLSAGRAGLALAVYGVGAFVTGPVSGRLCDRLGALRVVEGSLLLSGAVVMLIPLVKSYEAILALVLLWSLTGEAFRPAVLTVMTDLVGPEQRKTAVALVRLAVNIGMSLGPAAGGLLAMFSFPALFIVDGLTSLAAGVVMAAARWKKRGRAAGAEPDAMPAGAPMAAAASPGPLSDVRLVYFLVALIPVVMVFFQSLGAMPLHLVHHLRMPEAAYGLLLSVNTVMVILIEVPLSSATSHWPHRFSLSLGALLTGAGFGAMALARGYAGVIASVVIWSFGEMILLPTATTYVAELSPAARRGQYMGLFTMAFSLAFVAGPWLGTAVLERSGPVILWSGAFGAGLISALLMLRIRQERSPSGEIEASAIRETTA